MKQRTKIFGGSGENETRKKKVRKKKEEMQPMQRGDEVTEELKIMRLL